MIPFKYTLRVGPLILLKAIVITCAFAQQTIHVPADVTTIQGAINSASNGDTIQVAPGTYNENIDFKGKSVLVTSGATAFSDASVASTLINGSTDGPVVTFGTNEPAASVLNGFTIQNGHASASSGVKGGGIFISNASPQITNNVISNNVGCGVLVVNLANPVIQGNDIKGSTSPDTHPDLLCATNYGGASSGTGLSIEQAGNVQVIGNTIEDNVINENESSSSACGAAVYIYLGTQILLRNNTIRNNHSACTSGLYDAGGPPNGLILVQNLFYGNTPPNGASYPDQIDLTGTSTAPYPSITEINNTVYGEGQELLLSFTTSTISNNIFVNTGPPQLFDPEFAAGLFCVGTGTQTSPISFSHNDIFNSAPLQSGDCPLGPGNLAVDPQFLNIPGNDFHTQPISPVVATGDINVPLIPAADLDGNARTVCSTIDMGVYEIRPHPPITLTALPNPTPGRSTVTLTATLKGNCNVPTGLVTFLDGTTILGTASLNPGGVTTFSTAFLFVGTHIITATYAGDFNFEDSTSNAVTEVITGPPTTTSLNSVSPNPSYPLQTITLAASVSSAYTIPTGQVSFLAGGVVLATATVTANGSASATVDTLHAGTYAITAVYGGSTQYAASTSKPVTETVLGANTTTVLSVSPNPVAPGQLVTLTAKVSNDQSTTAVSGAVTFKDGSMTLGTSATVANGIATFSTSALLTGTHSISATYGGSQDLNSSTSLVVNLIVTGIPTSVGLNVSPNPASIGQAVTMVATGVATLSISPPTGTMTFSDQSGVLGNAALVSGVASFSTTSLSVGSHTITATLNPAGSFGASTSASVDEVVNNFNFSIAVSPNALTIPSSDYEIVTVAVTPSGGFPRPVTLSCSSLPIHTQCSFSPATTQALSNGPQTVRLTVDTSDVLGYGQQVSRRSGPESSGNGNGTLLFAGLLLPMSVFFGTKSLRSRNQRLWRCLLALVMMATMSLSLTSCSGKLPGATPPGNYVITVVAQDSDPSSGLASKVNVALQVTK